MFYLYFEACRNGICKRLNTMSDAIKTIDEKVLIDFAQSVSRLLDVLGSREKDILERRFKLQEGAKKKYTLEDIGKLYEITRERVRQIEADSIKKLRQVETEHEARQPFSLIHDAMLQYLKEHGGTIQEDYLVDQLMAHFKHPSVQYTSEETRRHREALSFIISQILAEHFEKITSKSDFHNVWKLKEIDWEIVSEVLGHLIDIIKKEDKPLKKMRFFCFSSPNRSTRKWKRSFSTISAIFTKR